MATPLLPQSYPDDFQIITLPLTVAEGVDRAIFYADRTLVVDSVVIGCTTADGNGTIAIKHGASPLEADITTNGTFITVATTAGALTAGAVLTPTIITASNANEVAAGRWVGIDATTAESFAGVVQIRFRSRLA